MINMLTDTGFLWGTQKTLQLMVEHGMTVYQYIMSYTGSLSSGYPGGVAHGEELIYLFDPSQAPYNHTDPLPTADYEVTTYMTWAWVNFARTGNPNLDWRPIHQEWEPCTKGQFPIPYLNITGSDPSMGASIEVGDRFQFWENLLA